MTHFGIFGHPEINTGGILEGTSGAAEPSTLENFLTTTIFTLQSSEPKVTTELFDRFTTSLSSVFTAASQERVLLGEASIDISQALSEQIAIREQQRVRDNEALQNTQIAIGQINERLSTQITELGDAFKDLSVSSFDPIKLLTDNPIIGGIGIGGLAVGAIVLLLLLRR